MIKNIVLIMAFYLFVINKIDAQSSSLMIPPLNIETASKFSSLAYSCISTEYPKYFTYTLESDKDISSPRQLHPAFFGCYDWHSSVHGHWLLVKLIQMFPDIPQREQIINSIDHNLSSKNIEDEINYFKKKE